MILNELISVLKFVPCGHASLMAQVKLRQRLYFIKHFKIIYSIIQTTAVLERI